MRRLADFLRGRRERLQPGAVGLPSGSVRRRSRGLRREEVAHLADISVAWYTRLEQGQDVHPSPAVLQRVADALRLEPAGRAHLFQLAGASHAGSPSGGGGVAPMLRAVDLAPSPETPDGTPPHLRRLLDGIHAPALIIDGYWDVVGRNAVLDALLGPLELPRIRHETPPRNVVRRVLAKRVTGEGAADWEFLARACVSGLRATLGEVWAERPDDPRATALVGLLTRESPEFRAWWPEQQVWAADGRLRHTYEHSQFGRIAVEPTLLAIRSAPGLTLVTHVPGDAPSAAKLRQLAFGVKTDVAPCGPD